MRAFQKYVSVVFIIFGFACLNAQGINDIRKEIEHLKEVQISHHNMELQMRLNRIINTTDFVRSAHYSLGALSLTHSLTDYLNEITLLNNPTNNELGFSLTQTVEQLLESHIFQGHKKVAGLKKSRFFSVLKNMIAKPVASVIATAVPVATALRSVVDMTNTAAALDDKIPLHDLELFRGKMSRYIAHYEGLAKATYDFNLVLVNVHEKTNSVKLLLHNLTFHRVGTLMPNEIDPGMEETAEEKLTLRKRLLDKYERLKLQEYVRQIIDEYTIADVVNYDALLLDKRLEYPDYTLNEARLILDEIDAVSKEYLLAVHQYQHNIEKVLENSKSLGNGDQIDRKIGMLQDKLLSVEKNFKEAVHVEDVEYRFRLLVDDAPILPISTTEPSE